MNEAEVICTLLIVVAALAILAKKAALPYPVLLVIGGLAMGFVPGLPAVQLDPDMVFCFCCRRCSTRRRSLLRGEIFARTWVRSRCSRSGLCCLQPRS
jgi:hypothetical protein